MISLPPTLDAPLPPDKFHGRERIVQQICERLLNPERLSTSVVGGPRTGKTSLLRYLASPNANAQLPGLPYRVYLDAQLLSSTSAPADFWIRVLDDLRTGAQLEQEFVPALDRYLQNARGGTVADYDLETAIRAFSRKGQTIVAFVDDWDRIVQNQNFWGDFLHTVRSLGQSQRHGIAFVFSSQRRLLDTWVEQMGSIYYNIFTTVTIGRMGEAEIRAQVAESLSSAGLKTPNAEAEQTVIDASDGHPYLVFLVTYVVTEQLKDRKRIDDAEIGEMLRDPQGRVVELIRQIRAKLSPTERSWLDKLRTAPQEVTVAQRDALRRLREYGLLPPGTRI